MRVIVIGNARQRRDLREALEHSVPQIVGEFDSIASARRSGIAADAVVAPSRDAVRSERSGGHREDRPSRRAAGDDASPDALTPREIEVLELVAEGLPNKAIADRLGISDQTVKFHIGSISGKLGAANRTDAVRRAVRGGVITL